MSECEIHHKDFKQFFGFNDVTFSPMKEGDTITVSDQQVEKLEFMCPDCRDMLYKELGYVKVKKGRKRHEY